MSNKILIDEATVRKALEALEKYHYYTIDAGLPNQSMLNEGFTAFTALRQVLSDSVEQPLTPEQTLDWLAQQHYEQCREERPIQHWIRKMKEALP